MKAALTRLGGWFVDRLNEKSTWAGIAVTMGINGHKLPPGVLEALNFWGMLLASGLMAMTDPKKQPPQQ
jgi:hypothetical protein